MIMSISAGLVLFSRAAICAQCQVEEAMPYRHMTFADSRAGTDPFVIGVAIFSGPRWSSPLTAKSATPVISCDRCDMTLLADCR